MLFSSDLPTLLLILFVTSMVGIGIIWSLFRRPQPLLSIKEFQEVVLIVLNEEKVAHRYQKISPNLHTIVFADEENRARFYEALNRFCFQYGERNHYIERTGLTISVDRIYQDFCQVDSRMHRCSPTAQ